MVRTERVRKYLEDNPTNDVASMVVDKIVEMKSIIYSAAVAKKIDTEFLDHYIATVESSDMFERNVINWIKDVNIFPTKDLTDEELDEFYSERLNNLFTERIGQTYGLEHLLKFLFKADWLLVYNTLLARFAFIPQMSLR
jgi:hypothetical protein